jgi:acetate kinase
VATSASVLVVNPGSSTLKLSVLASGDEVLAEATVDSPGGRVDEAALRRFLDRAPSADAAGVRVVHGGPRFTRSVVAGPSTANDIEAQASLAPLHNPPAAHALRLLLHRRPDRPVVACFDTTFHVTMPPAAATYAVPALWRTRWSIRRYGFHGLSHAYASRRAPELLGRPAATVRLVTCHLGAGASLAAIDRGVSVDTTMGFTPMEGLVMATRCGSIDPGILLWLQREAGMSAAELERALDRESGLLGLSGLSADMREVSAAARRGDPDARLALDVYVHRLRAGIAAMAAALERLDAVVFTGGVGEHAAGIRQRACAGLSLLGLPAELSEPEGDTIISPATSPVAVLVVRAREDLEIAREVRAVLRS